MTLLYPLRELRARVLATGCREPANNISTEAALMTLGADLHPSTTQAPDDFGHRCLCGTRSQLLPLASARWHVPPGLVSTRLRWLPAYLLPDITAVAVQYAHYQSFAELHALKPMGPS